MNPIAQHIEEVQSTNWNNETKVFNISRLIAQKIGKEPGSFREKFSYPLTKYRIVKTTRAFSNGWQDLYEINPINCEGQMGFVNSDNAPWIETGGTTTINLPPDGVVKNFFEELDKHLGLHESISLLSKVTNYFK